MSLLDKMEHRFSRFAIPGLLRYVVALNALVYILIRMNPSFGDLLVLNPALILHGEVWRLVTYIFIPQFGGLLPEWFNAAMYMVFLWWVGNGIEHAIGSFRLNLYYLLGMAGVTVAAFFTGSGYSALMLNTSLLFAFAQFYPDEIIFVFYILPAKVKWLAWLSAALIVYHIPSGGLTYVVTVAISLANFLVFFGPEMYRSARLRSQVADRRKKFEVAKTEVPETLHECVVCHHTEVTHPEMDFRVAKDGQEYCREHLPKAAG